MGNYLDLPLTGLETPLSEVEAAIQSTCHRFAADVLRPLGAEVDRMTPEDAVAANSPVWDALKQAQGLGISLLDMTEMPPLERVRLLMLASEELSWGDVGLGGLILVNHFPRDVLLNWRQHGHGRVL